MGCEETPTAKKYPCAEYSVKCELQKNEIIVLPLACDSNVLDAFGMPIVCDKNRWYLINSKVKVMVPVNFQIQTGGDVNSGPIFTYTPSTTEVMNFYSNHSIEIDQANLSSLVPGLIKAEVVVSGPNEMVYSDNIAQLAYAKNN